MTSSRDGPHLSGDWFPKEGRRGIAGLLRQPEHDAFDSALARRGDQESEIWSRLTVLGDQLANLALEVAAHGSRGGRRRLVWGVLSRTSLSLTAVVSAAIGGSVLAVGDLPPWGRDVLAGVAFLAAALGALQAGSEFLADERRHLGYGSLYRQILDYLTVEFPTVDPEPATLKLKEFGDQFDHIRQYASLPPDEVPTPA
jgi:hypothetical protein